MSVSWPAVEAVVEAVTSPTVIEPFTFPIPDMGHKPGCVHPPDGFHRTPIDCVTPDMLWREIDRLKADLAARNAELVALKARLFDEMEKGQER